MIEKEWLLIAQYLKKGYSLEEAQKKAGVPQKPVIKREPVGIVLTSKKQIDSIRNNTNG